MTEMLWVGTALLVALAGCVAWLRLVMHRKQSRELGSVPSPATDEGSSVEVKTGAGGPTPPPVDQAERAGSQLGVASETEPAASLRQTCDVYETTETVAPEPQAASLQESRRPEVESDFTEVPATGVPQSEHETVSSSVDADRDSQTAEELPADEPELEAAKEDVPAKRPAEAVQSEPVPAQPVTELAPSRQSIEVRPTQELEETRPGASPDTRQNAEVGEQGDATRKTTQEGPGKTPAEAAAPVHVPISHDVPAAGGERRPDELPGQTRQPPRPKTQKKEKRKHKPRKKVTRQRPVEKQSEESVEDARLLAEVPEITENIEGQRPRRTPRPSRYHPPSQEPVTVREPSRRRQPVRQARQQNFDLTVRLLFQRSGHFSLGLLPQRGPDLPEEIVIGAEGNRQTVAAVHDGWYEDIYPEDLASLLVDGIAWEGRTESEALGYWRLSGRDLYVLATHDDLRGFAQTTHLKIGREHVILSRNPLLAQVERVLRQVDCTGFTILDEASGAPTGWTVIRDVVPKQVGHIDGGPEILAILQPEPALEIELEGGIYLQQATWLQGFPPRICVSGDMQPGVEVFIDGKRTIAGDDSSFASQGYDTVGEHVVSIPVANTSRTYRITEGEEGWTSWDAHGLSRANLCGPLLRAADASATPRAVLVPSSNSVILGAKPGDIAYCPHIRGPIQVGFVTFHVVWAIPYDAFGCRKESTTIRLLSARRLVRIQRRHLSGKAASRVMAWCTAILNASRKGLLVDATDPHAPALWKEYKAHARALWKKLKK